MYLRSRMNSDAGRKNFSDYAEWCGSRWNKASGVKMSSRPSSSLVNTGEDSFDFLFKIVLIGDCGVGKTCVVQRFKSGTFIERHGNTIGVDFSMKTVIVDGKKVKVSF